MFHLNATVFARSCHRKCDGTTEPHKMGGAWKSTFHVIRRHLVCVRSQKGPYEFPLASRAGGRIAQSSLARKPASAAGREQSHPSQWKRAKRKTNPMYKSSCTYHQLKERRCRDTNTHTHPRKGNRTETSQPNRDQPTARRDQPRDQRHRHQLAAA